MTPRALRAWHRAGVAGMAMAVALIVVATLMMATFAPPVSHLGDPPTWPDIVFPAALALFTCGGVAFAFARWRLRLRLGLRLRESSQPPQRDTDQS